MKWQHCGKFPDHDEHKFSARQVVTVETCVCDDDVCTCPDQPPLMMNRPKERFRCPGKQVRSVEIPVRTEVSC